MITLTVSAAKVLTSDEYTLGNKNDVGTETIRVITPTTHNGVNLYGAELTAFLSITDKNGLNSDEPLGVVDVNGTCVYTIAAPAFLCAVEGFHTLQIIVRKADGTLYYSSNTNAQFKVLDTISSGTQVTPETTVYQTIYTNTIVNYYPLKDVYGTVGDGVTDDTTAFQNAINALTSGGTLYIPKTANSYRVGALSINSSIKFISNGATIKFKNLTSSATMFSIDTDGIDVTFDGIIFDGNKDNLTAPNETNNFTYNIINWRLATDWADGISKITVENCKFLNSPSQCIGLVGNAVIDDYENALVFNIRNNYFEKGFENSFGYPDTNIIGIASNCYGVISDNFFIKNEANTLYGLGAITLTISGTTVLKWVSTVIRNNVFDGYGRQPSVAGLGAIGVVEFYACSRELIIDGNKFYNTYCQAIRGKSNSYSVIITNNVIDGYLLDTHTMVYDYGIRVNRGTFFEINTRYIITGNIIKNTIGSGIVLGGAGYGNTPPYPDGCIADIIISDNIVDLTVNFALTGSNFGVYLYDIENAIISNNIINGTTSGIYVTNYKKMFTITGNQILDTQDYFIVFLNAQINENDYVNYDTTLFIDGNTMHTTTNTPEFACVLAEELKNIIVTNNFVRVGNTAAHFIVAGSNVTGEVRDGGNTVQGTITDRYDIGSGTLIGGHIAPELLHSWVNYGGSYGNVGYMKDINNLVSLTGMVKDGVDPHVFTLRVGFRPAAIKRFATTQSSGVYAQVDILANGEVHTSGNNAWTTFDGISFLAEG